MYDKQAAAPRDRKHHAIRRSATRRPNEADFKREGWRANPTKARRRQRRYTGLLTRELLKQGGVAEEE